MDKDDILQEISHGGHSQEPWKTMDWGATHRSKTRASSRNIPLVQRKAALITVTQQHFYKYQGPEIAVRLHSSPFLTGTFTVAIQSLLHYCMLREGLYKVSDLWIKKIFMHKCRNSHEVLDIEPVIERNF